MIEIILCHPCLGPGSKAVPNFWWCCGRPLPPVFHGSAANLLPVPRALQQRHRFANVVIKQHLTTRTRSHLSVSHKRRVGFAQPIFQPASPPAPRPSPKTNSPAQNYINCRQNKTYPNSRRALCNAKRHLAFAMTTALACGVARK